MSAAPEIVVIGGPNGAGKTSSAPALLPEGLGIEQFINADLIARALSPFAPERSSFAAGRLMLARIRELRARGESFAFETTLATRSYARFLTEAQDAGFLVHVVYIWLASPALARARVRDRVALGGHHIPDDVVERRYAAGRRNFLELYQPMANGWTVCDNSGNGLRVVAQSGFDTAERVIDPETYDLIRGVEP